MVPIQPWGQIKYGSYKSQRTKLFISEFDIFSTLFQFNYLVLFKYIEMRETVLLAFRANSTTEMSKATYFKSSNQRGLKSFSRQTTSKANLMLRTLVVMSYEFTMVQFRIDVHCIKRHSLFSSL